MQENKKLTPEELIDMFKTTAFPAIAEHLKRLNYEGLGEKDKEEFLHDTGILLELAEKGTNSTLSKARDARLLSGFIDVLSREMCLNKEIAAKLADDYLNIKSLTTKEYL